ncbi:MAG TPA: molybdopterin converting factor subunit 1 [Polyangiaceae bacterium]|nr:molybdopterin converting factor subunit 1 [Polyangiaceae bacterium]
MDRTVKVLYFAAVRDAVGKAEEELALPSDVITVAELGSFLESRYPALSGRLATVRFAVNEVFANPDARLTSGDVVAVIPPVSGG